MPVKNYKKPPIIEAVIDIAFSDPIEEQQILEHAKKLSKFYSEFKAISDYSLSVNVNNNDPKNPKTEVAEEKKVRLSIPDQTQSIVVSKSNYTLFQLAPYLGWDNFFERFQRDWSILKRSLGFRQINRIGVRYINRLDLPPVNNIVEYENYLNIYPHLPEAIASVAAYSMQVLHSLPQIDCFSRTNSGIVPSPLINYISFVIDIDIYKENNLPQSDQDVFQLLTNIRNEKNRIFEEYMKQPARDLFENV